MTIHGKAVEEYFTVVLFVFKFFPLSNFEKFIHFGLGIVRVKGSSHLADYNVVVEVLHPTLVPTALTSML